MNTTTKQTEQTAQGSPLNNVRFASGDGTLLLNINMDDATLLRQVREALQAAKGNAFLVLTQNPSSV
jgi:hypothetical protein